MATNQTATAERRMGSHRGSRRAMWILSSWARVGVEDVAAARN
jgi:hypothetical protein